MNTRQMEEFFGTSVPKYAILSHRWEIAEVTFQDFQSGGGEKMAGWKKIVGLCNKALEDGLGYAVSKNGHNFSFRLVGAFNCSLYD